MRIVLITPHALDENAVADNRVDDAFVLHAMTFGYSAALACSSPNLFQHLTNAYGDVAGIVGASTDAFPVFHLHEILEQRITQPMYVHILSLVLDPELRGDMFLRNTIDNLPDMLVLQGECFIEGLPVGTYSERRDIVAEILSDQASMAADVERFFEGDAAFKYTPRTAARRMLHQGLGCSTPHVPLLMLFEGEEYQEPHITIPVSPNNPLIDTILDHRELVI